MSYKQLQLPYMKNKGYHSKRDTWSSKKRRTFHANTQDYVCNDNPFVVMVDSLIKLIKGYHSKRDII
jgi:hypothetical protein